MDSESVIITMLALCGIATVVMIFSEPLKYLLRIVANSVFGAVAMFAINTVFGFTGLGVGINLVTVSVLLCPYIIAPALCKVESVCENGAVLPAYVWTWSGVLFVVRPNCCLLIVRFGIF